METLLKIIILAIRYLITFWKKQGLSFHKQRYHTQVSRSRRQTQTNNRKLRLQSQVRSGIRKSKQISYQELPTPRSEAAPLPSQPKPASSPSVSVSVPQPSSRLMWRLESLTRDAATAKRLIESNKAKFPEKSLDWCCEKAIHDLQRDRIRSY